MLQTATTNQAARSAPYIGKGSRDGQSTGSQKERALKRFW